MSIYDAVSDPAGPSIISLPNTVQVCGGLDGSTLHQFWYNATSLDRVRWVSRDPVSGIPSQEGVNSKGETWYCFHGYKCDHCRTTFFGTEWSDFVHDCVEQVALRRAA